MGRKLACKDYLWAMNIWRIALIAERNKYDFTKENDTKQSFSFLFIMEGLMEQYYMISDAAKEVNVETHVLRYWEEELALPIKRNDLGHRYYTEEDVECFRQIKTMKERGLQLKAIKVILKDGTLTMLDEGKQELEQVDTEKTGYELVKESEEEKSRRMQYLLQEMLKDAVRANNEALVQDIKEAVIKELDYQFRAREEREEELDKKWEQRNEDYYKRIDELLRKKVRKKPIFNKKIQK